MLSSDFFEPSPQRINTSLYSEDKIYKLINTLEKNKDLKELVLSHNKNITDSVLISLANALKLNNTLEKIEIYGIYPKLDSLIAISNMLRVNNTVQIIGLNCDKSIKKLEKEIEALSRINKAIVLIANEYKLYEERKKLFLIELQNTGFGNVIMEIDPEMTKKIFTNENNEFNKQFFKLNKIDLSGSHIDDSMIDKFLTPLYNNNFITRLILNDNFIGNIGLGKIVSLLRKNKTLIEINLEGNCIQSKDGTNLDELIEVILLRANENQTTRIKLGRNYLTSEAVQYLNKRPYGFLIDLKASRVMYQKNHLLIKAESKEYRISQEDCYVYLYRDKMADDTNHVMLLLQGMNNDQQVYVNRAHLTKRAFCGKSLSIFSDVLEVHYSHLDDISRIILHIQNYDFFCWRIDPDKMKKLINAIEQDISKNMKGYNCLMWAKKKLEVIDIKVPESTFDFWPSKLIAAQEHPDEKPGCTLF